MRQAQELAKELKEFWDDCKTNEVLPPTVHVVPKAERAVDWTSRSAAVTYTRHHLLLLAKIGSAIKQAIEEGCTSSVMIYEKPLAQNVNLLRADYCYAERKGGGKKSATETHLVIWRLPSSRDEERSRLDQRRKGGLGRWDE